VAQLDTPVRAGYAAAHSRAANGQRIGGSAPNAKIATVWLVRILKLGIWARYLGEARMVKFLVVWCRGVSLDITRYSGHNASMKTPHRQTQLSFLARQTCRLETQNGGADSPAFRPPLSFFGREWHNRPSPYLPPALRCLIRLKCIYNFWCSMLVLTPFALSFVTLRGVFMHFLELTN
jgi:hypothetical protein